MMEVIECIIFGCIKIPRFKRKYPFKKKVEEEHHKYSLKEREIKQKHFETPVSS